MADDKENDKVRDLRRLAKRYRITIQSPPDEQQWPAAYQRSFQNIRKIGDQKFDSFCASIDIRSHDEPWREQTKHRAEWLAKRACRLFSQQRNESGWRFGLENDVLRRFSVEVACPKCRARIWRSELEACINELDEVAANLEDRRKNRKPCTCTPNDRPRDYYEVGTNPLFDDRTQEVIIHDSLLRSQLPKQEPDRVYGLQATNNFEKLLSTPIPGDNANVTLGELVRSSPFKNGVEPLLFPFLILEAKSGKSSSGFYEIQMQTAFPIFALLKLQEDLLAQVQDNGIADAPLLWFFANRGDTWRVYGCCLSNSEPVRYDIIHLWDGSIMSKDSSLQLLLIVDYIFDWARDIYRPSILRKLKSIVTRSTFDQISLTDDSDIISMQRDNISNWVQTAPSTVAGFDFELDFGEPNNSPALHHPSFSYNFDHQNQSLLPIPIPNMHFENGILKPIEKLNPTETRIIELTQNFNSILHFRVRTFEAIAFNSADITQPQRFIYQYLWALADSQEAVDEVGEFIVRSIPRAVDSKVSRDDKLASGMFQMAFRMAYEKKKPEPSTLLQNVLKLWTASRCIEGGWRLYGSETLGLQADNKGITHLTDAAIIDSQLSSILVNGYLIPLRQLVLEQVHKLTYNGRSRRTHWLELLLVNFILLHNCECIMKQHRNWACENNSRYQYTLPMVELVKGILNTSKIILTYFHYGLRGQYPFSLDWNPIKGPEIAELSNIQHSFVKAIAKEVETKVAYFAGLHKTTEYEKDYWFTGQLFLPDWKPPDTIEVAPLASCQSL